MDRMATGVQVWWTTLCVLAVFNVCVWAYSAATFMKRRTSLPGVYASRWPHLLLSAGYVLGCGFRSILPRADVQRIVLYDSWLSSVAVGRSVATVAELCFAAQWALMLRELSESHEERFGIALSRVVVPMIVVAETCSWYAVLTTSYIGNALEQSIWTLTAAMLASALFVVRRRAAGELRAFLTASIVACSGFVAFMCTVDVPMYVSRWYADELHKRPYLSLLDGMRDVSLRWTVTHSWQEWHDEIAWMSLYFSFAVWISIALVHAPVPRALRAERTRSASEPRA
jgi:hypothetical protein